MPFVSFNIQYVKLSHSTNEGDCLDLLGTLEFKRTHKESKNLTNDCSLFNILPHLR